MVGSPVFKTLVVMLDLPFINPYVKPERINQSSAPSIAAVASNRIRDSVNTGEAKLSQRLPSCHHPALGRTREGSESARDFS
jgi:hypothetical protein